MGCLAHPTSCPLTVSPPVSLPVQSGSAIEEADGDDKLVHGEEGGSGSDDASEVSGSGSDAASASGSGSGSADPAAELKEKVAAEEKSIKDGEAEIAKRISKVEALLKKAEAHVAKEECVRVGLCNPVLCDPS